MSSCDIHQNTRISQKSYSTITLCIIHHTNNIVRSITCAGLIYAASLCGLILRKRIQQEEEQDPLQSDSSLDWIGKQHNVHCANLRYGILTGVHVQG